MKIQVRYKGNDYDVYLSKDGDHIVTKHDKKDEDHSFLVHADGNTYGNTYGRVVTIAQTQETNNA